MTDVFAIQDEICQAIVEKLRVQLMVDGPLIKRHTENVEAYNLYLKGNYHLSKYTPESMPKGKKYFERAISLDANYALAWCGLAWFNFVMGFLGYMLPNTANAQSHKAALKALELDEKLPEVHAMMAIFRANEFDWNGAEQEFRRALELGPKSEDVWYCYTMFYLVPTQRLDEAVTVMQKVVELDPLSELAERVAGTLSNISILKTDKSRAIRFSTLAALWRELECQPVDLLEHREP